MSDDEGLHFASFPTGVSVDLFTTVGGVLSAALKGCGDLLLAPDGMYGGNAARLLLRTDLTQAQVAEALRAAAEHIDPTAAADRAASVLDTGDEDVEMGHMRSHDDGSVSFAVGGDVTRDHVRELAGHLASVMLPAMDAMGAGNYLAWDFHDLEHGGKWELTITKPRGLTPHQARNRCQETLQWIVAGGRKTKADMVTAAREALAAVKAPEPTDEV